MRKIFISLVLLLSAMVMVAQDDDTTTSKNVRKGWTFGALPSVSFDADYGFSMGH